MEQQIISNKVYKSLQVPTENIRTTTGKILYANRYSGVAEVAMPKDLKELIDSDFGLIGKNILIQLEQKMRGYDNGPWYVDSRDGVIYIHNRKFHEDPVTTYTYQGENGEVLKVSFATQKITKNVKAILSPVLDPDTKDMTVLATSIKDESSKDEKKEEEENLQISPYIARVDKTQVSNYGSNEIYDHRSHPTTNPLGEWDQTNRFGDGKALDRVVEYNERVREYDSLGPKGAYEAGKQRRMTDMSLDELKEHINVAMNNLPVDTQERVMEILKNSKTGKELEANLKKLLETEMYLFKDEDGMEYLGVEEVDPRDYDPQHARKVGATAWGYEDMASVNRGMAALDKDPYVEVLSPAIVDYKNRSVPSQGIYGIRVKIRRIIRKDLKVPIYKLYHNLFSRYGGSDKFSWAANANANGGLKKSEKKLVCNLQVVGRPSLASSQVIRLENVGRRWSGLWYIKTCTHSMDAGQGYITDMELIRNNSKAGSSTSKTDLSTQTIVVNEAKDKAKTDKGKSKEAPKDITELNLKFTYSEKLYYNTHFLDDDGNIKDIHGQSEFIRMKAYYTEVNANDPKALKEGIVLSTGDTVTSKGELIPGTVYIKDIQVPDDYAVQFDYMAIARKIYSDRKKNKRK